MPQDPLAQLTQALQALEAAVGALSDDAQQQPPQRPPTELLQQLMQLLQQLIQILGGQQDQGPKAEAEAALDEVLVFADNNDEDFQSALNSLVQALQSVVQLISQYLADHPADPNPGGGLQPEPRGAAPMPRFELPAVYETTDLELLRDFHRGTNAGYDAIWDAAYRVLGNCEHVARVTPERMPRLGWHFPIRIPRPRESAARILDRAIEIGRVTTVGANQGFGAISPANIQAIIQIVMEIIAFIRSLRNPATTAATQEAATTEEVAVQSGVLAENPVAGAMPVPRGLSAVETLTEHVEPAPAPPAATDVRHTVTAVGRGVPGDPQNAASLPPPRRVTPSRSINRMIRRR